MLTIECPHCLTRVMPKADDTCPACRMPLRYPTRTDPALTKVVFSPRDRLPDCCLVCGRETRRRQEVLQQIHDDASADMKRLALSPALGGLIAGMVTNDNRAVTVRIPVCEECARSGADPSPRWIDTDTFRMEFIAHRTFRERLRKTRAEAE